MGGSKGDPYYGELFDEKEKRIIIGMVKDFEEENSWMRYPDHEALVQECFAHWYFARDQFNPARGASITTFMRSVIKNQLEGIREEQSAAKRVDGHFAVSLDEPIPDSELFPKDVIPDARGLKVDKLRPQLAIAISKLNPLRQSIYQLTSEEYSLREIGEKLGVSKSTVHEELQEIRRIFANEGLDEYLR